MPVCSSGDEGIAGRPLQKVAEAMPQVAPKDTARMFSKNYECVVVQVAKGALISA